MEVLVIFMAIAVFFINFIFIDSIYKIVDNKMEPFQPASKNYDFPLKDSNYGRR